MDNNIQKDAITGWADRSELDKTLSAGLYGNPELKREEKLQYLGEFKERVIKQLSKKQVIDRAFIQKL